MKDTEMSEVGNKIFISQIKGAHICSIKLRKKFL